MTTLAFPPLAFRWAPRAAVAALAAAALLAPLLSPATAAARPAAGGNRAAPGSGAMTRAIGCVRGAPPPPAAVACRPKPGTPHLHPFTSKVNRIRQLVQCGPTMYAVGRFSKIVGFDAKLGKMINFRRNNAFSFAAKWPFAVTGWNPDVNGTVNSVAVGGTGCSAVYLGGDFTAVHGESALNIAEVSASTGTIDTSFARHANRKVYTLLLVGGRLLVGGAFTAINGSGKNRYVSLDASTGRDDGYLNLHVSGHYVYGKVRPNGTKVYNQQLSHDGTRVLAEGDFTSVGGKPRQQIFMLSLRASEAHVTSWTSAEFAHHCSIKEPFYVRAAAWAPDDKTVYLATTGKWPWGSTSRGKRKGLCDAVSAFPASLRAVSHLWRNYTGCDSLYSIVAGRGMVYFGGHERWANNRHGCNRPGPGSIHAPGMGGVSPSGAFTFDPTRSRGRGADDMLLTSAGLWIASDNFQDSQRCGHRPGFAGICFLPG